MVDENQIVSNKKEIELRKFMKLVNKIYREYDKRINIAYWQQLLRYEMIVNADIMGEISERLLEFSIRKKYIPGNIIRLFNILFDWDKRIDLLANKFKKNDLDFLISKIQEEKFDYISLLGVKNGKHDLFISEINKIKKYLDKREYNSAKNSIDLCFKICKLQPQLMSLQGEYLNKNNKFSSTVNLLNNCIENFPNEASAYFQRGYAYFYLGYPIRATKDFSLAYKLDRNNYEALYWKGIASLEARVYEVTFKVIERLKNCRFSRKRLMKLEHKAYNGFLSNFNSIISKEPITIKHYEMKANALYELEKYQECIKFVKKAFKETEGSAKLGYYFIKSANEINKGKLALERANVWLNQFEEKYLLYIAKGDAYQALRNYEQSVQEYKNAFNFTKNSPELYYNLSKVYYKLGNYTTSIKFANKAIDINDLNGYYYLFKLNSLMGMNKYKEAFELVNDAIKKDKECVSLYVLKMRILCDLDKKNEAFDVFDEINRLKLKIEDAKEVI